MSIRGATAAAVVGLLLLVPTGCGDDEERDAGPSPKATVTVDDDGYYPKRVRIRVGGRVTWVNTSADDAHTAQTEGVPEFLYDLRILDAQNRFDTHTLQPGEAQSVEFDVPGRYRYFSSFDPEFAGVVEVVPAR